MPQVDINWLAVLVAAVIYMVIGAVWYSPLLFAKPWMKATGKNADEMRGAGAGYAVTAVAALIMSFVLVHFVQYAQADSFGKGIMTGLWLGIGIFAAAAVGDYVFTGRSRTLFWINVGYPVVALAVMGGLLAVWH